MWPRTLAFGDPLELRIAQSLVVLVLLSSLVIHLAIGGGSPGETGDMTDSAGRMGLRAQLELSAVLPSSGYLLMRRSR